MSNSRESTLILSQGNYSSCCCTALTVSKCFFSDSAWTRRGAKKCLACRPARYVHIHILYTYNHLTTVTTVTCCLQAYQSCTSCLHAWSQFAPPGARKKVIYDGYRRFLGLESRGRQRHFTYRGNTYQFKNVSVLPPPRKRTNAFVSEALAVTKSMRRPFLGHKCLPLLASWPSFDWYRVNIPDMMHDVKNVCENLLQIIVGRRTGDAFYAKVKDDAMHRAECQINGTNYQSL